MLFRKLNWNIVGWFRTVSAISYLVIALGVAAMIYHGFQGGNGFHPEHMLRLGMSFTGGSSADVTYVNPTTTDAIKSAVAPLNLQDLRVTTIGNDSKHFRVETQTAISNDSAPFRSALQSVGAMVPGALSTDSVGPTLGAEYLKKALLALVIALGIQFLYIAFRFGWTYIFGLVTVVALVRDALMMIGIYALAGKPADDAFLAAVLTVIGYSVMDTIVILDRIRENTKIMAGQPYDVIVNESIKQTMTRSFNTLATVVITLVALLALGGASLQNFAFALLVGICSGGYHSIFYSAPLVLVFRKRQLARAAAARRAGTTSDRSASPREGGPVRDAAARADIAAARRERRAKAKTTRPVQAGPTRYKRRRAEGATAVADEPEYDLTGDDIDPLDAQNSGLHDMAMQEGHEEINLNLEDFDTPHAATEHEHESDDEHRP